MRATSQQVIDAKAAFAAREEPDSGVEGLADGHDAHWWRQHWVERNETVETLRAALEPEGEAERLRALGDHLHEALAFMRSCELSGESGADHSTVISALEAYDGFEFPAREDTERPEDE
jgi:hypothetical protein